MLRPHSRSILAITALVIATVLGTYGSDALADERWYGSIMFITTFKHEHSESSTSDDGRIMTYRQTKHDRRGVVSATFSGKGRGQLKVRSQETRKTFERGQVLNVCEWTKPGAQTLREDTANITVTGSKSLAVEPSDINVSIDEDGAYEVYLHGDTTIERARMTITQHNYLRGDCPGSHNINKSHTNVVEAPLAIETFTPTGRLDRPDAVRIKGSDSKVEKTPTGTLTIVANWDLRRDRPARVTAVPGGPYRISRGDVVELNGSGSKGPIDKYMWSLIPGEGCPEDLGLIQLEGPRHSFPLLCSMTGFLTVAGADETDSAEVQLEVKARDWKVDIQEAEEKHFDERITNMQLPLGRNRCTIDNAEPNHFIHRKADSLSWRGEGYELRKAEQGPFKDYWYVASADLRMHRTSHINSRILKGGEIYELNQETNLDHMERLIRQVRAHEKMHTTLPEERLRKGPPGFDPAERIEAMIGKDEAKVQEEADFEIRAVDSELQESSLEHHVVARLKKVADFNRAGKVIVPDLDTGAPTDFPIRSFAELGD